MLYLIGFQTIIVFDGSLNAELIFEDLLCIAVSGDSHNRKIYYAVLAQGNMDNRPVTVNYAESVQLLNVFQCEDSKTFYSK